MKSGIYRKDPSLPTDMRYYGGHPPEILEGGTPWPGGNSSLSAKGLKWRPEYLSSLASPILPARWS